MTARRSPRPPSLPERILRGLVGLDKAGSSIVGDLHEEFISIAQASGPTRARLWYWRQVVGTGMAYARPGRASLQFATGTVSTARVIVAPSVPRSSGFSSHGGVGSQYRSGPESLVFLLPRARLINVSVLSIGPPRDC